MKTMNKPEILLMQMGTEIRRVCGKELGEKLVDEIEPLEDMLIDYIKKIEVESQIMILKAFKRQWNTLMPLGMKEDIDGWVRALETDLRDI